MSKEGKLIVFSSPSGAGKTTIVRRLLANYPQLQFSISACTRPIRTKEENGKDYYFLSLEAFKQKIKEGAFIEWEEVYAGNYYGTLKNEVERIWAEGKHVVFDIDVKGALNIKKQYGKRAITIFIKAPSLNVLKERLEHRGSENHHTLAERLERAKFEFSQESCFDQVVLNDNLSHALEQAEKIVAEFIR